MPLKNKLLLVCVFLAGVCHAQEVVKDINKSVGTQPPYFLNYSQRCYQCNGKAYAVLIDAVHGSELWVTDGTTAGTHIVKDIAPGFASGVYQNVPVCLNNIFYFKANGDPGLWKTDGTEAGTQKIFGQNISSPVLFKGKIVFTSDNMLLTTDGTTANTVVVKSFSLSSGTYEFDAITSTSDRVFLKLRISNADTGERIKTQLWTFDGNTTTMIKEVAGYGFDGSYATVQNKYLFTLSNPSGYYSDVWVSDGTVEGTKLLQAYAQLSDFQGLNSSVGNKRILYRSYGRGTWITDGTTAGTTLIFDNFSAYDVREFKDKVYYLGNDEEEQIEYKILRTNADFTNRVKLTEPLDGTALLGTVGDKLLFATGTPSQGVELMTFDGNQDIPSLLKDINPGTKGSYARSFVNVNSIGVFLADDGAHGYELWKSDGTAAGTSLLKDVATNTGDAEIREIYFHDKNMYFIATDDVPSDLGASRSLWKSDGTTEGTSIVDATNHNYYGFIYGGSGKYFISSDGYGVNKTDVETGVRSQLFNTDKIYSGTGSFIPNRSLVVGDDLYMYFHFQPWTGTDTGYELWRINPVTNELVMTKDINPGPIGSAYAYGGIDGAAVNNKVVFGAFNGTESEPWVTDGKPENTVMLKDIGPSGGSFPYAFTTVGNKVFFIAQSTLWSTDGTSAGTQMIHNARVISTNLAALGTDKVVYGATTAGNTTELWISDGTSSGTKSIKTINTSKEITLSRFTSTGDRTYFVEDDKQLWVTDGTESGTMKIDFENNGIVKPDKRAASDGVFYFINGDKLWLSYGSTASTQALGPSNPVSDLFITDKYICFVQNDAMYGNELFRYALPDPTITGLETQQAERIITLYPNPTEHTLYINVTSDSHARVVDASGREYLNQPITNENNSIDVSSLSPGMYFVSIKDNTRTYRAKFLKR